MMKINKKMIIGATLLTIGVGSILGITHSKYINKVSGNGETEIAKWYFSVNEATEEMETIKLADTYKQGTLLDGKIAPGTSRKFWSSYRRWK